MPAICPVCAEHNREGARFCDQCGARLTADLAGAADRTIELRPGTALFCDLVQSTRLANSLDVDDLRGVFKGFRQIVAGVVSAHAGHLIQFSGDGAFVLFGYPKAREDAAESALHSALALVDKVRDAGAVAGAVLELRVGIASGPVVTGDLEREAEMQSESVVGSIVHLAARLVAKAPPGRVVIDDATRHLSGRFFEYRSLGRLKLKGFDQRVQAWLVLGTSAVASRFEAKREDQHLSEFVGRTAPLASVRDAWAGAVNGKSAVVVVEGEAGIGKSRMVREVRRDALDAGALVLDLDCSPRASNTPLHPVGTLLRRLIEWDPKEPAAATARAHAWVHDLLGRERGDAAFPYVASLLDARAPLADAAESADRFRERRSGVLVELVQALAEHRAVFILFEDAHWADPTTLELMAKVADRMTGLPILIVATTRPADGESRPLTLPGAVSVALAPLDDEEAAEVVRCHAPDGPLPPDLVTRIVARCEGNPLYLEEATRAVLETAGDAGREHAREALRDVPTSLQGLVQTRLDRLPGAKPVIQAASVIGREISLPVLAQVLPDRADLPQALDLLVERELLVRASQGGDVRFKHALIHDAVYRTIVRSERQRLHSKTADVLAAQFAGQAEAGPDVLAPHLAAAQRYKEATVAFADASDLASGRAAYAESIAHCRAALDLTGRLTEDSTRRQMQRRVLIRLGVALAAQEGYASQQVLDTYREARRWCVAEDDPADVFPVVRGLGTFSFVRGDLLEADALSEHCLELARQSRRPDLLIEALSFRGYPTLYRGQLAESRRSLEECLAVYRAERGERFVYPSAQDPATAAWSLLATTAWLQGDAAAVEVAIGELLAHVDRLQRPFDEAYARVWIAGLRHLQRRVDEALEHANIAIAISQKHGYNTWLAAAVMMASMAMALRTSATESIELLRTTHQAFMRAGAYASASFYLWGLARACALRGDRDQALAAVAEATRLADLNGERYMISELLAVQADLDADEGQALLRLQSALQVAEEQGAVTPAVRAASVLIRRFGSGYPDDATRASVLALDGAPYPSQAGWTARALQSLKQALPAAGAAST